MMTIKDLIDELTEIASEEGNDLEVVATDNESGETYTPVISIGPDKDGIRRMRVC